MGSRKTATPPEAALEAALDGEGGSTGPLRRCLVTRVSSRKETMLRFVLAPDGVLVFDAAATLPGRGMWLSASRLVVEQASKRGIFSRAAKMRVATPADLATVILGRLTARMIDLLGLARRSGAAIAGFEKAREWVSSGKAALVVQAADGSVGERARFLGGRDIPVAVVLDAARLGRIFGRDEAVHIAIAGGKLARMIEIDAARLTGVAGGETSGQMVPAKRLSGMDFDKHE